MTLTFLLVPIRYGIDLVKLTLNQPSPSLMWPVGYAYLAIPVGCSIMFYQTFILMIQGKSASGGTTKAAEVVAKQ